MPLKQQVAEKKAQEYTTRINPEIDAKLDRFVQENPKLHEYYQGFSKDQLIRKLMLGKMQRSDIAERRNQELVQWVNENLRGRVKTRQLGTPQNPPLRAGGMFGIGLKGRIKRKRMSERKMAERAPGWPRPTGAVPETAPGAQREVPRPGAGEGAWGSSMGGAEPRPSGLVIIGSSGRFRAHRRRA